MLSCGKAALVRSVSCAGVRGSSEAKGKESAYSEAFAVPSILGSGVACALHTHVKNARGTPRSEMP
jgi:hypothetical protein